MSFLQSLLRILDARMTQPVCYGWFHILCLILTIGATVALCVFFRKAEPKKVCTIVLATAILVVILEIYKQIDFSFAHPDGIYFQYLWYAFPWQFCSTPMYIGLLAGIIRKGHVHDSLCAYLATYGLFAGLAVMIYPGDVFVPQIGINIQTMICHGSMIVIAIFLIATGHVKLDFKTVLRAAPVFSVMLGIAMILNEVMYRLGIQNFNMFFVSPHCAPSLPVFSLVQPYLPFALDLLVYILGFTAASFILSMLIMAIRAIFFRKPAKATV